MAHRRSSSFYKILLDPSAPHLPLPPDFASSNLDNKIPKNPTIRSATGGYSWQLKIKKIGESFCFSDGWNDVVTDIHLTFGDLLVFELVGKSVFQLFVYSPNGCEKEFPPKIEQEIDSVHDDDDNEEEAEVEDDDNEEEAEVDDEDDDDDDDDEDEELEEYEEENGDDDNDEDDGEDDVGGDIDGHDGDPFFMVVMSKSHKNMLRLPSEFVKLAGIDDEGTLKLKNVDGKEWEAGLRLEKGNQGERYYVSTGWTGFRRDNDLCDGDECVFKFITSEDKLLLARVSKKKRPASQVQRLSGKIPADEIVKAERGKDSGKVPVTEVVKTKRERPQRNSAKVPVTKVVEMKRGQRRKISGVVPAREGGGRPRKQRRRDTSARRK